MNKFQFSLPLFLLFACDVALADQVRVICTSRPTICTTFGAGTDRYDPLVQHLLVRRELDRLPRNWRRHDFYLPYTVEPRELEELQIRYLDQLNQRRVNEEALERAAELGAEKALERAAKPPAEEPVEPSAPNP